jgi:hypothetical protein
MNWLMIIGGIVIILALIVLWFGRGPIDPPHDPFA